jgi:hypothetical protein
MRPGAFSGDGLGGDLWHSETPDRMVMALKSWEAYCVHPQLPGHLGNRLVRAGFRLDGASVFPVLNLQWDDSAYCKGWEVFLSAILLNDNKRLRPMT